MQTQLSPDKFMQQTSCFIITINFLSKTVHEKREKTEGVPSVSHNSIRSISTDVCFELKRIRNLRHVEKNQNCNFNSQDAEMKTYRQYNLH